MPDPISTLALATGGAFLGKFVGPAAEHLGKLALERAQQLGEKATALLAAVGREPQPIEPKLLVPLVQAASLESDPTLTEKWASLLANAADPACKVTMLVRFAEVLRLLSPPEVKILQHLDTKRREIFFNFTVPSPFETLATRLSMTKDEFELAVNSLLSSMLCELPPDELKSDAKGNLTQRRPSKDEITLSVLGASFLDAVSPPTL